jgi:hypothetical protein
MQKKLCWAFFSTKFRGRSQGEIVNKKAHLSPKKTITEK